MTPKKFIQQKTPKGRPTSTSAILQPLPPENLPFISSFSQDGNLFALVTLAIDKHRIRVFNAVSGRATAEYTIQAGRVSSLTWGTTIFGVDAVLEEARSPNKKRKKRKTEDDTQKDQRNTEALAVIIGLSDGTILFFSPSHEKVVQTLSHPSSTSAITSLATSVSNRSLLWTSNADSSVQLWDVQKNLIWRSWKNEDRIPYTSLAIRPTNADELQMGLLGAHHQIRLFTDISLTQENSSRKPKQIASFTGHASSIKELRWDMVTPHRFFSVAESDRFVYLWETEGALSNERPIASTSLDSDVRTIGLDISEPLRETLVALSSSGKLYFIPIPTEFPSSQSTSDKPTQIHTILPRSTLTSGLNSKAGSPVIDFVPIPGDTGVVRIVRLLNGVRPVFDIVRYIDDRGNFEQNLTLSEISDHAVEEGPQTAPMKRYVEPSLLRVGSGADPEQADGIQDSETQREVDGTLQADLAELSLGQRLAVVTAVDVDSGSESGENEVEGATQKRRKKKAAGNISIIPVNSLTRTLIQALHSSDSRLLEMCLAHSDPALIRNTVRRLPPQLAIPLVNACVERLGRGARGGNMKGGGGGASSQRGMVLVTWVNTVLAVHTGHLMTIPDIVARLSGLYATLTARLSLHESLLSLSGRLDTVLSQVEYRASRAPTTFNHEKAAKAEQEATVRRYVEGESESDEEEGREMDVEVEDGEEDEGSVEDIELGGDSGSNEEDSDDSDQNEFIDDEAEEDEEEYTDEEGEEDSE